MYLLGLEKYSCKTIVTSAQFAVGAHNVEQAIVVKNVYV